MERVAALSRQVCAGAGQAPGSVLDPVPVAAHKVKVYPPGKHFVTDPRERLARYEGNGGATPARTVCECFRDKVKRHGSLNACAQKRGARDGPWTFWTWSDYHASAMAVGKAMIALGCSQHEAVSILGFNSPEWFFTAVGGILAGLTPAGVYTTNSAEACEYIVAHSRSRMVFVDSMPQLQKVLSFRARCPSLKAIVHWGADCPKSGTIEGVMSWAEFMSMGSKTSDATMEARISAPSPDNACYLSYTSGTTGNPKAVLYSHDNIMWSFTHIFKYICRSAGDVGLEEREVSYMPLSHIAGNVQLLGPFVGPPEMNSCVYFAFPDAMQGTLTTTLVDVKPTIWLAVPRVWEKLTLGLQGAVKAKPELKNNAMALRSILGLQSVKVSTTGAAPIGREVMEFWESLGMPIMEIYGMTENAAYSHYNYRGQRRVGSVGPELVDEGAGSKIAGGSGEICTWSRGVMMGYMYMPEKSADTFDDEGFLRTGDVGTVDADGFTFITGRIKELIITAGGENCAPVILEDAIKKHLPAVSNAVMIGDRQKYLTALLTLKLEPNTTGGFTNKLAAEAAQVDPSCTTFEQALQSPRWKAYLANGIEDANKDAISRAQQTRKFTVLPGDFSPVGEKPELTPTMKLRREVVREKYQKAIKDLYGDDFQV